MLADFGLGRIAVGVWGVLVQLRVGTAVGLGRVKRAGKVLVGEGDSRMTDWSRIEGAARVHSFYCVGWHDGNAINKTAKARHLLAY